PLDEKRNKEAKDLVEFKDISSKTRMIGFSTGEPGTTIFSHGFRKKENKLPLGEILQAKTNRLQYLERLKSLKKPEVDPGRRTASQTNPQKTKHAGRRK